MMNNLSVGDIVSQGFKLGMQNLPSLIGAVFLWLITLWIPYFNVGTTIGLLAIIVAMSKGNVISPTEIFNAKYRRYIGEFFLLVAFMYGGILIGYAFLVIPGIVIAIAWGQALYLMVDKGLNPTEALKTSNDITYGKKWIIFGGMLVLIIILSVVLVILTGIGSLISDEVAGILGLIGFLLIYPILMGGMAHIYGVLTTDMEPAGDQSSEI